MAFLSLLPASPCTPRATTPARTTHRPTMQRPAAKSARARTPPAHPAAPAPPPSSGPAPPAGGGRVDLEAMCATAGATAWAVAFVYLGLDIAPAAAVPEALVEAFKSTPASLVHPGVMWGAFGASLYAFYLGWQSRSIRTAAPDARRALVQAKVTRRHFETASALFAATTVAAFSGMGNTYARTGKLFPGPHLYAGLGLVAVMATMSALVPSMQAGKLWAKQTHFALAFGAVGLFAWQAQSGMQIVAKLLHWE